MGIGRKLALGAAVTTLLAGAALCALWVVGQRDRPHPYEVVRGDTLGEIATAHGVTVTDLKAWNGLTSDLIEVGQVLLIWRDGPPPAAPGTADPDPSRRRVARPEPATQSRVMPKPKDCLEGPSIDDPLLDEDIAGSAGLDGDQIRTSMAGFGPLALPCIDGHSPAGALHLEIRVACTGLVSEVHVLDAGDWPEAVAACVTDTLRYTPFPAHDLPDGEVFEYPLRFTPSP